MSAGLRTAYSQPRRAQAAAQTAPPLSRDWPRNRADGASIGSEGTDARAASRRDQGLLDLPQACPPGGQEGDFRCAEESCAQVSGVALFCPAQCGGSRLGRGSGVLRWRGDWGLGGRLHTPSSPLGSRLLFARAGAGSHAHRAARAILCAEPYSRLAGRRASDAI